MPGQNFKLKIVKNAPLYLGFHLGPKEALFSTLEKLLLSALQVAFLPLSKYFFYLLKFVIPEAKICNQSEK